jgi:hypothetical protein
MKHLLNGVVIAALLAIAGPVWAQQQGQQQPPPMTSAMPPAHHVHAMHHFHKAMAQKAAVSGDTTAQLNREELARINSGNMSNPPPAAPMPEAGPQAR